MHFLEVMVDLLVCVCCWGEQREVMGHLCSGSAPHSPGHIRVASSVTYLTHQEVVGCIQNPSTSKRRGPMFLVDYHPHCMEWLPTSPGVCAIPWARHKMTQQIKTSTQRHRLENSSLLTLCMTLDEALQNTSSQFPHLWVSDKNILLKAWGGLNKIKCNCAACMISFRNTQLQPHKEDILHLLQMRVYPGGFDIIVTTIGL